MKKEVPFAIGVAIIVVAAFFAFEAIWHQQESASSINTTYSPSTTVNPTETSHAPTLGTQNVVANSRFKIPLTANGTSYTVVVYSPDEQVSTLPQATCQGDGEEYTGDYQLVTLLGNTIVATSSVGQNTFDPVSSAFPLYLANPRVPFIALSESAGCNNNQVYLYAMNSKGAFIPVSFLSGNKSAQGQDSVLMSIDNNSISIKNNMLLVHWYNNAGPTAGYYDDQYGYNGSSFVLKSSHLEQ